MKINIKIDTDHKQDLIKFYLLSDILLDMEIAKRVNQNKKNQITSII